MLRHVSSSRHNHLQLRSFSCVVVLNIIVIVYGTVSSEWVWHTMVLHALIAKWRTPLLRQGLKLVLSQGKRCSLFFLFLQEATIDTIEQSINFMTKVNISLHVKV